MKIVRQSSDPLLEGKIRESISDFYKSMGLGGVSLNIVGVVDKNEADASGKYTNKTKTVSISVNPNVESIKIVFDAVHEATHALHYFLMESGINADTVSTMPLDEFNTKISNFFVSSRRVSFQEKELFANFLKENNITKDFVDLLAADYKYYPPMNDYRIYATALSEVSANDFALRYVTHSLFDKENVVGEFKGKIVVQNQAYRDIVTLHTTLSINQFSYYNEALSKDISTRLKEQIRAHGVGFFSSVSRCYNEIKDLKWELAQNLINASKGRLDKLLDFKTNKIISEQAYVFAKEEMKKTIEKQNIWTRECMARAHIDETRDVVPGALIKTVPEEDSIFRTWVELEAEKDAKILAVDVENRIIYYNLPEDKEQNHFEQDNIESKSQNCDNLGKDKQRDADENCKTIDEECKIEER